jgi:hypothetical protein
MTFQRTRADPSWPPQARSALRREVQVGSRQLPSAVVFGGGQLELRCQLRRQRFEIRHRVLNDTALTRTRPRVGRGLIAYGF